MTTRRVLRDNDAECPRPERHASLLRRLRIPAAIAAAVLLVAGTLALRASQSRTATTAFEHYPLYTHCGIRYVRIGTDVYLVSPTLGDGNGNPPAGWGNPYQYGRLVISSDGIAEFTSGDLRARFVLAPNAVPEGCD